MQTKTLLVPLVFLFLSLSSFSWAASVFDPLAQAYGDPKTYETGFDILSIPSGGLYASMGGHSAAVDYDSSFLQGNAAVTSVVPGSEIIGSYDNWSASSSLINIIYKINIPKMQRLGLAVFGTAYLVPFLSQETITGSVTTGTSGFYSEWLAGLNMSYNFIPGLASNVFSMGINIKATFRALPYGVDGSSRGSIAVMGDWGILGKFNLGKFYSAPDPNFSIGFSLRNLGEELSDNPDPLPSDAILSVAWKPLAFMSFSLDFFAGYNLLDFTDFDFQRMGGSFNMYFQIVPAFAIQAGTTITGSELPSLNVGLLFRQKLIDFGLTYSFNLNNVADTTLIGFYVKGKLSSSGRAEKIYLSQAFYGKALQAYEAKDYNTALADLDKALVADPYMREALKLRDTIKNLMANQGSTDKQQLNKTVKSFTNNTYNQASGSANDTAAASSSSAGSAAPPAANANQPAANKNQNGAFLQNTFGGGNNLFDF